MSPNALDLSQRNPAYSSPIFQIMGHELAGDALVAGTYATIYRCAHAWQARGLSEADLDAALAANQIMI